MTETEHQAQDCANRANDDPSELMLALPMQRIHFVPYAPRDCWPRRIRQRCRRRLMQNDMKQRFMLLSIGEEPGTGRVALTAQTARKHAQCPPKGLCPILKFGRALIGG